MDLSKRHEKTVDGISLAYAAFNKPHFADFVLEEPTKIIRDGQAITEVYHYAGLVSLPAVNRLFAVKGE